jgi:hypothetical protein
MTAGRYSLFVLLLLAAGCSHQSVYPGHPGQGTESLLQDWVHTELAPYVSQQLGQHPRFKGEPVIIVRLDGDDIQPDIDALTRSIRDQLMDSLLNTPGVRVPWQPQQQPAQHHRRLDRLACGRLREASYFIGIEITRTATAQFRVSVRALDVQAGEWVSGFSQHWSGNLTGSELRSLQERRTDESLRGLRELPFSAGQPDLAAAYLSNNLSCLLRQQDVEDLKIKVETGTGKNPQLHTLLHLIANNLSRFREVQITDTQQQANFILRGETHMIQPGLYQVWVILHPRGSGEHLAGMDTATYMRIAPAGGHPGKRRVAQENRVLQPSIARMELVRRSFDDRDSCADRQRGCPVLEVDVEQADAVFVIAHGTRNGISRLSGTCKGSVPAQTYTGRYTYRFPESRFTGSDWPTVYAIAVSGAEPGRQFRQLLGELPDACSNDNPAGRQDTAAGHKQWLERLDRLIAANRTHAVWTARRVP